MMISSANWSRFNMKDKVEMHKTRRKHILIVLTIYVLNAVFLQKETRERTISKLLMT